jgi:hypothetical protein
MPTALHCIGTGCKYQKYCLQRLHHLCKHTFTLGQVQLTTTATYHGAALGYAAAALTSCFLLLLLLAADPPPQGVVSTRLIGKVSFRYPFAVLTYLVSAVMGLTAAQVRGRASCTGCFCSAMNQLASWLA